MNGYIAKMEMAENGQIKFLFLSISSLIHTSIPSSIFHAMVHLMLLKPVLHIVLLDMEENSKMSHQGMEINSPCCYHNITMRYRIHFLYQFIYFHNKLIFT